VLGFAQQEEKGRSGRTWGFSSPAKDPTKTGRSTAPIAPVTVARKWRERERERERERSDSNEEEGWSGPPICGRDYTRAFYSVGPMG